MPKLSALLVLWALFYPLLGRDLIHTGPAWTSKSRASLLQNSGGQEDLFLLALKYLRLFSHPLPPEHPISLETVSAHLEGNQVLGAFWIFPASQSCQDIYLHPGLL